MRTNMRRRRGRRRVAGPVDHRVVVQRGGDDEIGARRRKARFTVVPEGELGIAELRPGAMGHHTKAARGAAQPPDKVFARRA